jgi:hypothetical protein
MGMSEGKRCTCILEENNKMDLEDCEEIAWNELIWLSIGKNDGHARTW